MLDLELFLDLTGKITWWLSRKETWLRRNAARRALLQFEELEERVVPTLLGQQLFPADYPWNQNIANAPVAANSAAIISHIGGSIGIHPDWGEDSASNGDSPLYGIPYNVVHGNSTAKVNVIIDNYPGESDIVPVPIPANAVIEGDYQNGPNPNGGGYNDNQRGDSHLIVWDEDNNTAYELFGATRPSDPTLFPNTDGDELAHTDGLWHAAQETVWNMNADDFRTLGDTSADAAGLSILAGLARPDEGLPTNQGGQGAIDHALRFTLPSGDVNPQYIYPASHQVDDSSGSTKLPFGARLRLESTPAINTAIAAMGPEAQIIAHAMQQYGLVLADIGSAMYVTGSSAAQDANNNISLTWNMDDVLGLHALTASDFQVVNLTPIVTGPSATSGAPGSTITVTGQNFSGSAGHLAVFFGSLAANAVTYVSDTQITAVVPAGSGTVNVTVQSGVNETDYVSDNQNANVTAPIFGYGTSAITSADQFTLTQSVSGSNSTANFASPDVNSGATDVLTIVVRDVNDNAVSGLSSSAFAFNVVGASTGTFGSVSATTTAGTYVVTFTGVTAGTASALTVTINGVSLSSLPSITVIPVFAVISPSGIIAAAAGYDRPTFSWSSFNGADHYYLLVTDKNTASAAIVVPSVIGTAYVPTAAQALTPGHSFTISVHAMSASNHTESVVTQSFSLAALAAPSGLTPSGAVAAASGYDRPTFQWNASAGAGDYHLVVHDQNSNTNVINISGITGTNYSATAAQALTPGHSFIIYVSAVSTNGRASTRAQQTFSLAALAAPTGLTPSGTIVAAGGYDRPTFQWNASTGADHYSLVVHDQNTNTNVIVVSDITGTNYSATAAQALTPGHRFTMNVRAVSTNNRTSDLATQTFSLPALGAPALVSPIGLIGSSPSNFTWSIVPGADHYHLYVFDDTTNTAVINNLDLAGNSFSPTSALKSGHKYIWRVAAVSTNNRAVVWSISQDFTIA
jgi:IPT/TIG domain